MNTNDKNIIVRIMDWIVDTFAKTLVSLFDGVKNAVDHANPSLFALVATLLPFVLPLPVAFATAHSAQQFFGWEPWAAWTLGLGLEGLGLLVWVRLADAIVGTVKASNEKVESVINLLWCVAIAYEAVLVLINVILAFREGASLVYALTLLLVCFLPALSAFVYGLHRRETLYRLEHERKELAEQKERERQERRQDRKEAQAMKMQYAADTKQEGLKNKPFRKS
jgi:hypothetical protein